MSIKDELKLFTGLYPVEGFNPQSVKKEVLKEDGTKGYFLPLVWKKAWARKIFPLHRCEAEITSIKDGYVGCKAKFYVDNEPDKAPIGEGFAFVTIDFNAVDKDKARNDACLMAIGSAKARAYSDAGFGLEFFTDCEIEELEAAAAQSVVTTPDCNELLKVNSADASENSAVEENSTDVAEKKTRATQYEMAKKANEELLLLRAQIPTQVSSLLLSTKGSVEHSAAEKSLEKIKEKWNDLSQTISKKMTSQQVQADRQADIDYEFVNSTYEQELANAKLSVRNSMKANSENASSSENSATVNESVEVVPEESVDTNVEVVPEKGVESTVNESVVEATQTTMFEEMDLEKAKSHAVVTAPYVGILLGDMLEDPVKKNLLPILFGKSEDESEKKAIKLLIETDESLVAYCQRTGRALEI